MKIKVRAATGLTLTAYIRRDADGFVYDWADGVFQSSGWTTSAGPMPAVTVSPLPGGYYETANIVTTAWSDGVYTVFIAGAAISPIEFRITGGDIWEALLDVAVSTRAEEPEPPVDPAIVTITVKEDDTGGAPIAGVAVEIRSTLNAFIDRQYTDALGNAVFSLEPGTYYVYLSRVGVPMFFTRPQTMVVPAASTYAVEYFGVPFVPIAPSSPGYAVVYDYLYNLGLTPRPGIDVKVKVTHPNRVYLADGPALTSNIHTKTNADGLFSFTLPRQVDLLTPGVLYTIEIESVGFAQEFAAADLDAGGAIILSSLSV